MALEKSIFDDEMIAKILRENWDISLISYKKMELGTANCYLINSENDIYFLKEYQSEILESQIIIEGEILERLQVENIPSAYFINTVTNDKYIKYRGHYVVLEKYICGDSYDYYNFPDAMLSEMAVMLAKIHLALKGLDLPSSLDEEWVKTDAILKYRKLQEFIEEHKEDPFYEKIKEDLSYKQSILQENQEKLRKAFIGITYKNSHGDYQGCQLIGDGDGIKAVIDFTAACRLPVVWEIMRSFIQTSRASRIDGKIDIQGLCRYVKAYWEYAPLNACDVKSMPYVYVYQLLRSTYGYKEYLLTDSEDREGLISFAFWRTRMCREVLEHSEEIVDELVKVLGVNI